MRFKIYSKAIITVLVQFQKVYDEEIVILEWFVFCEFVLKCLSTHLLLYSWPYYCIFLLHSKIFSFRSSSLLFSLIRSYVFSTLGGTWAGTPVGASIVAVPGNGLWAVMVAVSTSSGIAE